MLLDIKEMPVLEHHMIVNQFHLHHRHHVSLSFICIQYRFEAHFSIGCDPSGTYTERDGRCVCKYNVEGALCNQCKRTHFYLNQVTPNGCLSCFCSGVTNDCTSTSWRRQPVSEIFLCRKKVDWCLIFSEYFH